MIALVVLSPFMTAAAVQTGSIPPAGMDSQIANIQLVDSNGLALSNVKLLFDYIPSGRAGASWKGPEPFAAWGSTDRTGHMVVNVHAPTNSQLLSSMGAVNFQVYVVNGHITVPVYAFARFYGSNATLSQNLAIKPQVAYLSAHQSQQLRTVRSSGQPYCCYCPPSWSTYNQSDTWTTVGELHTETWVASATFKYGSSANTTVSVDTSTDGKNWSANGSIYISATARLGQRLTRTTVSTGRITKLDCSTTLSR